MPDYIIFENWPDIDRYLENKDHPYDGMTLEQKYAEYLKLKNKYPKTTDEELSRMIGKRVHFFANIKKCIKKRRKSCGKRLLQSV